LSAIFVVVKVNIFCSFQPDFAYFIKFGCETKIFLGQPNSTKVCLFQPDFVYSAKIRLSRILAGNFSQPAEFVKKITKYGILLNQIFQNTISNKYLIRF